MLPELHPCHWGVLVVRHLGSLVISLPTASTCLFFGGPALDCGPHCLAGVERVTSSWILTPPGRWGGRGRDSQWPTGVPAQGVINIPASWSDDWCGTHTVSPAPPPPPAKALSHAYPSGLAAWCSSFAWWLLLPGLIFPLCFRCTLGILLMHHLRTLLHLSSTLGEPSIRICSCRKIRNCCKVWKKKKKTKETSHIKMPAVSLFLWI